MESRNSSPHFAVCVANDGAEDLQLRKVYRVVPKAGDQHGMIRVVDDSAEDYLYPDNFFVPLELPASAEAKRRWNQ